MGRGNTSIDFAGTGDRVVLYDQDGNATEHYRIDAQEIDRAHPGKFSLTPPAPKPTTEATPGA